jgi:hypothetical protein
MAGRSLLVKTAWLKSSLLDTAHNAADGVTDILNEEVEVNDALIEQLAAMTMDDDEKEDQQEDEFTGATNSNDAHDVLEHMEILIPMTISKTRTWMLSTIAPHKLTSRTANLTKVMLLLTTNQPRLSIVRPLIYLRKCH